MTNAEKAARVQEYVKLKAAGKSNREIGQAFGVKPQSVWAALRYLEDVNFRNVTKQRTTRRAKERYHADPEYRAKAIALSSRRKRQKAVS